MPSAGVLLREERTRQDRPLSYIATATCIPVRYLLAIEEDNLKALPGDFFYRSYIRQYAQALHLGSAEIARVLSCALPFEAVDPIPGFTTGYQAAKLAGKVGGLYKPGFRISMASLVLVVAGCSGLFAMWQKSHGETEGEAVQPKTSAASDSASKSKGIAPSGLNAPE